MDKDNIRDIKPGLLSNKPIVNDSCSDSDSDSSVESKTPDAYKATISKEKSPPKIFTERPRDRSRSRDKGRHKRSHDSHGHGRHRRNRSKSRDQKSNKHRDSTNKNRHKESSKSDHHKHRESSNSIRHKESSKHEHHKHRESSNSNRHKESSKYEPHKHQESSKNDVRKRRDSSKSDSHKPRLSPKTDAKKDSPRNDRHRHRDSPRKDRDSSQSGSHKHSERSRSDRRNRKSPKRSPSPRDRFPEKRRNYKDDLRDEYCDEAMDPLARAEKIASNVDSQTGRGRVDRARRAQDYQATELVKKAEQLTGITLPKFYKPSAINPLKFAETEQKRKLLWSKKSEPSEENKTVWNVTSVIASRGDDKAAAKFKKLMGIHDSTGPRDHNLSDLSRKVEEQAELFRRLDADYQSARAHTHTSRGVGLGYNQTAFIDPSLYLAGRRDIN